GMARNRPIWLGRNVAVSPLALENIERMVPNSIGCVLERVNLSDTGLINIFPALRIHGDCEIESFRLTESEEAHVAAVLAQKKPFCVGRVKDMDLKEYAVGVITKMSLKDCEIKHLSLAASEEAHVAAVLAQKKPFCVGRVKIMRLWDYAVGVITKMSLKDCEFEWLWLTASEEAHVAEVLAQEKPFCVGRVEMMWLREYAVGVITKMSLKDCEIKYLSLAASEEAHVAEVLKQEKPFCAGRVKDMHLWDYAVGVITKMSLKDCEIERLCLTAREEAHVAAVLKQEKPFCAWRVKDMVLREYAVGVITKMSLKDCEFELLYLSASKKTHVAEVLKQEKPFCVGRVKRMDIWDYAVGVITKMSLEDCEFEYLSLSADKEAHVAEVLAQEKPFCVGRVKDMHLWGYAASVITKMTIHEDNTMERFVLAGHGDHFSRILEEGDNSIDLGRIRTGGLRVPEEIKRKLRYTLVDGEGEEVLEEENDEEEITTSDGETSWFDDEEERS
ncbi:MAG: uncharacterized protein A8A55_2996, partial [Amphiamblys sp. WSBS2006]